VPASSTVTPSELSARGAHAEVHHRLDLADLGRRAALTGEVHGLRRRRRVVGDRVRLGSADDRDVAAIEPQRLVAVESDQRRAAYHGDQGQRRLVLDPQRPGRVQARAHEEGAARPRSVEQSGDSVHGGDPRRSNMISCDTAKDSLSHALLTASHECTLLLPLGR
jgi:hypothetical protein